MGADDGGHKDIKAWAFENGASLIFGFKKEPRTTGKFKTQHVMLGGHGEVARGSFKGEHWKKTQTSHVIILMVGTTTPAAARSAAADHVAIETSTNRGAERVHVHRTK
jgi:hypothetical protein